MTEPEIQALIEGCAKAIYIARLKRYEFTEEAATIYWGIARRAHDADPIYGSHVCKCAIEDATMAVGMTLHAMKEI